jgi:hypothetical protein
MNKKPIWKKDDLLVITGNSSSHFFNIGSVVVVAEDPDPNLPDKNIRCDGPEDREWSPWEETYWWINTKDAIKIGEL